MDFTKAFSYINQYGDKIKIFGSGIYKADSYFKASIFIGTDFAILFFGVPLFALLFFTFIKRMIGLGKYNYSFTPRKADVIFLIFSGISLCHCVSG